MEPYAKHIMMFEHKYSGFSRIRCGCHYGNWKGTEAPLKHILMISHARWRHPWSIFWYNDINISKLFASEKALRFGGTPIAISSIYRFGVEIVSENSSSPKTPQKPRPGPFSPMSPQQDLFELNCFYWKYLAWFMNFATCITFSQWPAEGRRSRTCKNH